MEQKEETMLSIRSMIQRFRETKPTSRQEREQVRTQRKLNVGSRADDIYLPGR